MLVCMFNQQRSSEKHNAEKESKLEVLARVCRLSGAREKESTKDLLCPYQEPVKVSWLKRLRRIRGTDLRELGKLAL